MFKNDTVTWLVLTLIVIMAAHGGADLIKRFFEWQYQLSKEAIDKSKRIKLTSLIISVLSLTFSVVAIIISIFT